MSFVAGRGQMAGLARCALLRQPIALRSLHSSKTLRSDQKFSPPAWREQPRQFKTGIDEVLAHHASRSAEPLTVYSAPPHSLFYTFSYTGSSLFALTGIGYGLNTAALPATPFLVRFTAVLVVTGAATMALFWTRVSRRLVKTIELIPAASLGGSSTVRITMRKPFLGSPTKVFNLPAQAIELSHRFSPEFAPILVRNQLLEEEAVRAAAQPVERGPISSFFHACIEDHKVMTQPHTIPKVYINDRYFYLDPRGEFLGNGRAIDRVFKLHS